MCVPGRKRPCLSGLRSTVSSRRAVRIPQSLSSVYFYFDPEQAGRRLGTFSALWEIEWAREMNIPHYYLGYWVAGCGAMEYKASFRPCEALGTDGVWREMGQ